MHQLFWMGACKMFRTLKCSTVSENKDWTCDPCSPSKTQQSTPPPPSPSPTPAPSAEQISDDSTFNVLQLNDNGIGNKLTELGVVLERNNVKVAVIQESKLSSKSKNPGIRNYSTVRKDRPHGHCGGLLVFIHESIPFSKQPSSPEALSDPHLEELTIKANIGNTKLIMSNIYIHPASQMTSGKEIPPPLNCQDLIMTSRTASTHTKGEKWRKFVETLDQNTDVTKLWRTIKGTDGKAKREAENESITFNISSYSSSKQISAGSTNSSIHQSKEDTLLQERPN